MSDNDKSMSLSMPLAILIGAVIIAGAILFIGNEGKSSSDPDSNEPADSGEIQGIEITEDDRILGDKDAPVTIVEYSDFQCIFCRVLWGDALESIKDEYVDSGEVRLVFRHFPLSFHEAADVSAHAVECAGDQGMFWELHDKIFEEQNKIDPNGTVSYNKDDILDWALDIDLDVEELEACIDSGKYSDKIAEDTASGASLGVSGTPGSFVNGKAVVGAQPFEVFEALIDEALIDSELEQ
ncbi:MAG: DsbA family protein [Parcubacteria group bacterium]